jgi:hypothetical protein
MSNLNCPHCHNKVPRGAKVCRGCQAELQYGPPKIVVLLAFVAATFVGAIAGRMSHTFGWISFGVILVATQYGIARAFKDRVIFKRIYRTR